MHILCCCTAFAVLGAASAGEPFIVHEWGVHITGSAPTSGNSGFHGAGKGDRDGLDGESGPLPRPILGPPQELIDDLPPFVGRHDLEYRPRREGRSRWRKPVLHFYGSVEGEITVEVLTPQGRPLAYWPLPQLRLVRQERAHAVGMRWTGRLTTAAPAGALPPVAAGHWWQRCREVPGLYLNTATGSERFLFYEGTSRRSPTVTALLHQGELSFLSPHGQPLAGPVVVIVNDAGSLRLATPQLPQQTKLGPAALQPVGVDGEAILAACRAQWEAFGMSPVEARMIVEVWREDLLTRPGFLVITRMSPADYAEMFPLTITPTPDQLVRVGLVFDTLPKIPAAARLAWLPRLAAAMQGWAKDLAGEGGPQRTAAIAGLAKAGDLASPLLDELRAGSDLRVRAAALDLLGRLRPPTLYTTQPDREAERQLRPLLPDKPKLAPVPPAVPEEAQPKTDF